MLKITSYLISFGYAVAGIYFAYKGKYDRATFYMAFAAWLASNPR
jgi:hypothetical protein